MAKIDAKTRAPAVAGMFYPAEPARLDAEIGAMLARAPKPGPDARAPKAIVAPHAGIVYSGPIAASVYARLEPAQGKIERVVLLGPAHRLPFRGIAATSADAFATPLGRVPIDRAGVERALALEGVGVLDRAFDGEHGLEVHLPFLQIALGTFDLVPFVVGSADPARIAALLEALWAGRKR